MCFAPVPRLKVPIQAGDRIWFIVAFLQDVCQEARQENLAASLQHVGERLDGGAGLAEVPHLLVHAQLDVGDAGVVQSLLQVGGSQNCCMNSTRPWAPESFTSCTT